MRGQHARRAFVGVLTAELCRRERGGIAMSLDVVYRWPGRVKSPSHGRAVDLGSDCSVSPCFRRSEVDDWLTGPVL